MPPSARPWIAWAVLVLPASAAARDVSDVTLAKNAAAHAALRTLSAWRPGAPPNDAQLKRMYDHAPPQVRLDLAPAPRGPGNAPSPSSRDRRARNGSIPPPGRRPPPLIVPLPKPPPAYRRTFQALLADPDKTDRYDGLIVENAERLGLDARLLKAIIAAESEFDLKAISPKGARGLMQVMPLTAEEMGVPRSRLLGAEGSILAGASYLRLLFEAAWRKFKLQGTRFHEAPLWLVERIIASYHAGPRFLNHDRWHQSTRGYIRKVLLFYQSRVTDIRRPKHAAPAAFALRSPGFLD